MKNSALQTRLILFLLVLIIAVVGVTLQIVLGDTYTFSTTQLQANSERNSTRIKNELYGVSERLSTDVERDAKDFSIRGLFSSVINEQDIDSFLATFDSPENRFKQNYDVVIATDAEGTVFYHSLGGEGLSVDPRLHSRSDFSWINIEGQYYLLKAAEVRNVRSTMGWLAYGKRLGGLLNDDSRVLIGMDVWLVLSEAEGSQVIASTIAELDDRTLPLDNGPGLHDLYIDLGHYLYTSARLTEWQDVPMHLVMATIEENAYLSYEALAGRLIVLTIGTALIALLIAVYIARSISRPINMLIEATNRIQQGEYVDSLPDKGSREVISLSGAIDDMQNGIRQREQQINKLAYFDELTGLPNRNKFLDELTRIIERDDQQSILVLMMDVDRFKEINDTVGHDIGDGLLKLIAERLSSYYQSRAYYARLGGDEFGIIMSKPKGETPDDIAKGIVAYFEQPFNLDGLVLDVDVSMGVAVYPEHATTMNGLMQCADIALYSCKGHHHHYAIYAKDLNRHSLQRLNLMSELKEALSAGQLSLYYQPKLDLQTGKFSSVECLIRWIHPEHGFVPPDEFIPLAEQTGAIRHVTHWALHVAIHQHVEWRIAGHDIAVAVNISAIDLIDLTLPGYVEDVLQKYKVAPDRLILEVTESAIMSDPEIAIKALNSLHRMGITLSIDDFGTGYSSLAQLKKMPVSELKIDKAFILDLANNPDDRIMVSTMLALGKNLGLQTVAEGVEDEESLQLLTSAGCDKAQGFHLSRPLPLEQFNSWLAEHNLRYEGAEA